MQLIKEISDIDPRCRHKGKSGHHARLLLPLFHRIDIAQVITRAFFLVGLRHADGQPCVSQ